MLRRFKVEGTLPLSLSFVMFLSFEIEEDNMRNFSAEELSGVSRPECRGKEDAKAELSLQRTTVSLLDRKRVELEGQILN